PIPQVRGGAATVAVGRALASTLSVPEPARLIRIFVMPPSDVRMQRAWRDGSIGAWTDARAASRWHGATLCATAECENFLVHPERVPPWLTRMLRCVALWKCASFQLLQPCVQAHAVGG